MKSVPVELSARLAEKTTRLRTILSAFPEVGVAFSGGVDSTLLARVARDTLGKRRVRAFHLHTPLHTERELVNARQLAEELDMFLTVIRDTPLDSPGFAANPPERCYICKKRLYTLIIDAMRQGTSGGGTLIDGTNLDDLADHRPGLLAARELEVRTPLAEAGLTKEEIRRLARSYGISNWDLPSASCLATRIPFGKTIVAADLLRVARLEEYLLGLGLKGHRVRLDDERAVVELEDAGFQLLAEQNVRDGVCSFFHQNGVRQIFLNLQSRKSEVMTESTESACST